MHPFVIGDLNLVRCLGLEGVPFYGVSSSRERWIFHSRGCIKGFRLASPSADVHKAFESLKAIVDEVGTGHALYYSNDGHLTLMSEYYDEIAKLFTVNLPPRTLIEASLDKKRFFHLCRERELPIAPTIEAGEDLHPDRIRFPVVLKPLTRVNWFKSGVIRHLVGAKSKVVSARTPEDYRKLADAFAAEELEYVVQQHIPGPESNVVSFHTYLDAAGKPLGWFTGRKIRTTPNQYGRSSFLRLTRHPELVELGLDICGRLGIVGPVKLDFKIDADDGRIYLLEFNPRYNLWHRLGAAAGVNLPLLAWRHYRGELENTRPVTDYRTDIRWANLKDDLAAFREMRRAGRMSLFGWLASLRGRLVLQTAALNDPLPALWELQDTFRSGLLRLCRMHRNS
jgi:predicted ATP-grasp superfamily ATP-dependent carboligase